MDRLSKNQPRRRRPPESGSAAGGTEYNMSDPKQKAAYKAQKSELERQRGKSKFADIRGGDGQKSSGNGRLSLHRSQQTPMA